MHVYLVYCTAPRVSNVCTFYVCIREYEVHCTVCTCVLFSSSSRCWVRIFTFTTALLCHFSLNFHDYYFIFLFSVL